MLRAQCVKSARTGARSAASGERERARARRRLGRELRCIEGSTVLRKAALYWVGSPFPTSFGESVPTGPTSPPRWRRAAIVLFSAAIASLAFGQDSARRSTLRDRSARGDGVVLVVPADDRVLSECAPILAAELGLAEARSQSSRRLLRSREPRAVFFGFERVLLERLEQQHPLATLPRESSSAGSSPAVRAIGWQTWVPVAPGAPPALASYGDLDAAAPSLRLRLPTVDVPESWVLATIADLLGIRRAADAQALYYAPLGSNRRAAPELPLANVLHALADDEWTLAPWSLVHSLQIELPDLVSIVPEEGLPSTELGIAFTADVEEATVSAVLAKLDSAEFVRLCDQAALEMRGTEASREWSERRRVLDDPAREQGRRWIAGMFTSLEEPSFVPALPIWWKLGEWLALLGCGVALFFVTKQMRRGRWRPLSNQRSSVP